VHTRTRVCAAAVGALVTIVVWAVHLTFPEVFTFFLEMDSWAKFAVAFVLAPPFVLSLGVGSFLYPQPPEPASTEQTGPMSAFFYQERASRRWKLLVAAAIVAAVNFLLMFVTSGI
jgi:hypothetical protein